MIPGIRRPIRGFRRRLLVPMAWGTVSTLTAATVTWKTNVNGSYTTGNNWTGNTVPAAADTAHIANGGTSRIASGANVTISRLQATNGRFLVDGGTVSAAYLQSSGGILEMTSGTVTATTDARISATNGEIRIGGSAVANLPKLVVGSIAGVTGAIFTVSGNATVVQNQTGINQNRELWIGGNNGGDGSLVLQGNATLTNRALGSNSSQVMVGRFAGGAGNLTIRDQAKLVIDNDVANPAAGNVRRLIVADSGSSGTVNLDGGTVTTIGFMANGDNATVNANGGAVKALRDEENFFNGFTGTGGVANRSVNLLAGGLKFDTNGFSVTIPGVLSGSGGLTKQGDGTLVLSGRNTFTGPLVITGGELHPAPGGLAGNTAITISGGRLHLLEGAEDMVASLTLGSAPVAASGTWGSSSSPADNRNDLYFSGAGMLQVGPVPPADPEVSGLDAAREVGPYFNGTFSPLPPGQSAGWTVVNAFPGLSFVDPIWLAEIPGTTDFLLVCKDGRMWRFPNNHAVTQADVVPAIDLSASTMVTEDQGFYHLAFHPEFGQVASPNRNFAYICYSHKPVIDARFTQPNGDRSFFRLSRVTWDPATGTFDPASETILINQFDPQRWHNGGALFFDNEGYLHVTCGDGGDAADSFGNGQRNNLGFFSGILRIDVDNKPERSHPIRRQPLENPGKPAGWPASYSQGYMIPNDNPWLDPGGSVLEEYFAIGLRSPHTAHYDAVTGDIWVGDVGQGTREELDRVTKGANCQWSYREGFVAGPRAKPADLLGFDCPPVHDYGRDTGSCIIGGMRYRGNKWAEGLGGKVLFADIVRGVIWTATLQENSAPLIETLHEGFRTGSKTGIANFCTDSAGEIYMMDLNGQNKPGGIIRKLAKQTPAPEPPRFLSQTGIFTDLTSLSVAPGVIPYDVASPLWSDGAEKRRWIIVPNDGHPNTPAEKISFSEDGPWIFPAGTVFVKHFEMAVDERQPGLMRRLETRFLICTDGGGKYGITYKWNAEGTDAELLAQGESMDFNVTSRDGGTLARRWDFPSRGDCLVCHTPAAGQALGFRTHQLNKKFTYPLTGRTANQINTFSAIKLLDRRVTPVEVADFLEARGIMDETAPLEHRVRSYLDSNCSHCHQPAGAVEHFDARLSTPLARQGLVDAMLLGHFSLGPDGRYLKPGNTDHSAVYVRMANVSNGAAMPPLAKNLLDEKAVAKLGEYLQSITPAEFQPATGRPARCQIAGPSGVVPGPFEVTVIFDTDVTDFSASDLTVNGGSVGHLRGKGYYYVATIIPSSRQVSVTVAADAVNPQGFGSLAPPKVVALRHVDPQDRYGWWAATHELDGDPATGDGDDDGIVDLLEFAFNLDPGKNDRAVFDPAVSPPAGLPRMNVVAEIPGQGLSLQFLRRRSVPGLLYHPEFGNSPDMLLPAAGGESVTSISDEWEMVTVPDEAASGEEPQRFGRIRVSWTAP